MKIRTLILGALCAFSVVASAQMGGPSLSYNPLLMLDPAVKKELHLSDAEASKIASAIMSEAMKALPAMSGAMSGKPVTKDQQKEAAKAMARMESACVKDLSESQRNRFHEITLQSYGPTALLDQKLGAQVGITPAQADAIKAALKKAVSAPGGSPMGMMSAVRTVDVSSILNAKQKAKWKAMQGKPIKLSPLPGIGGPMGGMGGH